MRTIIVDDEPLLIKSFKRLAEDFKDIELVGEFSSALKTLEFVEENPVDLACLDVVMPGMSGIELAKCIKERYPLVMIVFVTAHDKYIRQSNEIGADYYIVKPYTSETIGMMVDHIMRLFHSRKKEEIPYGVVRCTNEEYPKITYANEEMLSMLGMDPDGPEWKNYIRNNVFFAVPMRDREKFRGYLDAALSSASPFSIEHRFIHADGREINVIGWIRTVSTENGSSEFDIMYMPAAAGPEPGGLREASYIEAIKKAYAVVFELDLNARTVTCIEDRHTVIRRDLPKVSMTYDSAKAYCLDHYISDGSRESISRRMDCYMQPDDQTAESENSFTTEIKLAENKTADIECQFIRQSKTAMLFCCRLAGSPVSDETAVGQKEMMKDRNQGVYIRTFGYFDVFVNGEPVLFRYEKAKELLAVLVDRRGGFVSGNYAVSCLWEDENYSNTVRSRYRQTAARLNVILKEYGIEDILENVAGQRRIVPEKVKCDLFEYYAGVDLKESGFKGSYMLNYSWAEVTQADLAGEIG